MSLTSRETLDARVRPASCERLVFISPVLHNKFDAKTNHRTVLFVLLYIWIYNGQQSSCVLASTLHTTTLSEKQGQMTEKWKGTFIIREGDQEECTRECSPERWRGGIHTHFLTLFCARQGGLETRTWRAFPAGEGNEPLTRAASSQWRVLKLISLKGTCWGGKEHSPQLGYKSVMVKFMCDRHFLQRPLWR